MDLRRISKRDQLRIVKLVKAIAASEGIVVEEDTQSDYPLLDLIIAIIEQGQENGWPLVKMLIETILPLILQLI